MRRRHPAFFFSDMDVELRGLKDCFVFSSLRNGCMTDGGASRFAQEPGHKKSPPPAAPCAWRDECFTIRGSLRKLQEHGHHFDQLEMLLSFFGKSTALL